MRASMPGQNRVSADTPRAQWAATRAAAFLRRAWADRSLAGVLALGGFVGWGVALLVWWFRLPLGVSNKDEAFYSALAYGFIVGNKPYLDELAIHQNASLLLVPFFRAYLWARGSS